MTKVLELKFSLSNNKTLTMTIANPKPTITDVEVNAAMTAIVNSNYYNRDGVTITGKKQARFVERAVTDIAIA